MSHNYYSEINLHVVWHTKTSSPLITPAVEPLMHQFLKTRIANTSGAFVHEIGGTETHVHMAITIPPTMLLSKWIGELKGGTAHDVNQKTGGRQKTLQWQAGYGVVSFGSKDLEWVVEYIRNQREHHARGPVYDRLEQITFDKEH